MHRHCADSLQGEAGASTCPVRKVPDRRGPCDREGGKIMTAKFGGYRLLSELKKMVENAPVKLVPAGDKCRYTVTVDLEQSEVAAAACRAGWLPRRPDYELAYAVAHAATDFILAEDDPDRDDDPEAAEDNYQILRGLVREYRAVSFGAEDNG